MPGPPSPRIMATLSTLLVLGLGVPAVAAA
jgi:hypothetical protein